MKVPRPLLAPSTAILSHETKYFLTCRLHLSTTAPAMTQLKARKQGLTLVHFSAQLEPCLSQENTLHTLNNP